MAGTRVPLGEIRPAKELGLSGGRFQWCACPDCGKERWVELRKRSDTIHRRCLSCTTKHQIETHN